MAYADGKGTIILDNNFNGFLDVHLELDFHLTINDAKNQLHCEVTGNRSHFNANTAATGGFGFINFAAFGWDNGVDYERGGVIQNSSHKPLVGDLESWDKVYAELKDKSGGDVPDKIIWGVYACDHPQHHDIAGEVKGSTSWDYALSASDFNADGSVKDRLITKYYSRWYYYNASGAPSSSGIPSDTPVVASGSNFTIHLNQIFKDYFPFATFGTDGKWRSCNRNGGVVATWGTDGQWHPRKNSENKANAQHAWYWSTAGDWTVAPKIGEGSV